MSGEKPAKYEGMLEPGQILIAENSETGEEVSWFIMRVFPVRDRFYASIILLEIAIRAVVGDRDLDDCPYFLVRLDADSVTPLPDEDRESILLAYRMILLREKGDIQALED